MIWPSLRMDAVLARRTKSLWSPSRMLRVAPAREGRQQPRQSRGNKEQRLLTSCRWLRTNPGNPLTSVWASQSNQQNANVQRECQVFRGKESNETFEVRAWEKTPCPSATETGRVGSATHLVYLTSAAAVEPLSGVCERQPPVGNKRGELACRYIVAVTWWHLQITQAGGSEGNSGHFQTRGQEIDIVSSHSNHDRRLSRKPHFHHTSTPWLRSVFKEIPHVWR